MQPRRRNLPSNLPRTLPGATEFTADPVMNNPDWVVQTVNALTASGHIRDVFQEVHDLFAVPGSEGRPRVHGHVLKMYAAYVASKTVGVETFHTDTGQNPFWRESGQKPNPSADPGFEHRPSLPSLWRWFAELESSEVIDLIERAGDELYQLACANDPEIGRNVMLDFTAYFSPSRAYHVCRGCRCPRAKGKQKQRRARMHTQIQRADAQYVSEQRHEEAKALPLPDRREERREKKSRKRRRMVDRHGNTWVVWRNTRGCLIMCLDLDAGGRVYDDGRKAWVGGYRGAAVDMKYGGTVATVCFGAHRREHAAVPALVRKLERANDGRPIEAISGDRGVSMDRVFWLLERRNIDPIIPWRKPNGAVNEMAMERTEHWDEDGPRCKHCGGPTTMEGPRLGRAIVNGEPLVRFRCLIGATAGCMQLQSRPCGDCPRILTGVSKESERYQALASLHSNLEKTFNEQRARFGVSGKDNTLRLRRRGVGAQRLRAAMARYLEWLYICLRHGWLGSHAYRNLAKAMIRSCKHGVDRIKRIRARQGLLLPYGPKAHRLGLAATPEIPRGQTKRTKAPPAKSP